MKFLDMICEYKRLRNLMGGRSYRRLEAFGLAIANVEKKRRSATR